MKTASDIFSHQKENLSSSQGFTLLELVVSISIIALVFVSLFRMQSGSIDLVEGGRFYTNAPVLAQEILGQIRFGQEDSGTQENFDISHEASEGFARQYPGMTWTCQVTDVGNDMSGAGKAHTKRNQAEDKAQADQRELAGPIWAHARGLKKIVVGITQADRTYEVTTLQYVP